MRPHYGAAEATRVNIVLVYLPTYPKKLYQRTLSINIDFSVSIYRRVVSRFSSRIRTVYFERSFSNV
jgi:hypothetical protein